jgi:hypothetical protein
MIEKHGNATYYDLIRRGGLKRLNNYVRILKNANNKRSRMECC